MTLESYIKSIDLELLELEDYGRLFILSKEGQILNPPDNQCFLFATPTADRLFNTCKISSYAQIHLRERGIPDLSELIPLVNADDREKPSVKITFDQAFTGDGFAKESWEAITPNDILFIVVLDDMNEYISKVKQEKEAEIKAELVQKRENQATIRYYTEVIPLRIALHMHSSIKVAKTIFLRSETYQLIVRETALFSTFGVDPVFEIWEYEHDHGTPYDSPYLAEYAEWIYCV